MRGPKRVGRNRGEMGARTESGSGDGWKSASGVIKLDLESASRK
jgi:hypothetical protein